MSKILITGAGGFIGSNIHKAIDADGIDDYSFGYRGNNPNCDVKDFKDLSYGEINKYGIIVIAHCSNIIYSECYPMKTFENNVLNFIRTINDFDGKIINLSTSSVYGNAHELPTPEEAIIETTNAYSMSKRMVELYLNSRGNYTTLRLSNVYGENQRPNNPYCGVVNKFIYKSLTGEKIPVYGTGRDTRDFTYVGDVVRAVLKAIELPPMNTEINIGTGVETSIVDFLKILKYENVEYVPNRGIDGIDRRVLDVLKAERLLDWKPTFSLREGIEITKEWIQKEYLNTTTA